MNHNSIHNLTWLAAVTVVLSCALVEAQAPPAEPPAPVEQLAPETNPAVLAALELPRTEPRDYLFAVLALADLERPELARPVLDELLQMNLTDAQRAALVDEYGSHRLLALARNQALAPAGGQLADACLTAAAAAARHPDRLRKLIDNLSDPSPAVRSAARVDLATTGMPGVVTVAEAFGRESDPARRSALGEALIQLRPLSIGQLVALLETNDHDLRAEVFRLLARLDVNQALPLIAADAVREPQTIGVIAGSPENARAAAVAAVEQMAGRQASGELAERVLVDAIGRYRLGTIPFALNENGRIDLWQWDGGSRSLKATSLAPDDAHTIWMARLALALAELRPDNHSYQRQFLVLGLEADGLWNEAQAADVAQAAPGAPGGAGHTPPLLNELMAAGEVQLIDRSLADALKHHHSRAAEALAAILGTRGDAGILLTADGQPAPLARALESPNRRVQFAALAAILKLDPQSPYPGSSRVPERLGYFANGTGARRAVVVMPNVDRAANVAGLLHPLGIDAEISNRGSTAVKIAQETPDLEFVLVDMNVDTTGVRDILYALRIDPATGQVPIGLLAPEGRLADAQALADEHTRMIAFPRPHSPERAAAIADRLVALAGHNYVSPDERVAQASQAVAWLADLLAAGPKFYDLRRQAGVLQEAAARAQVSQDSIAALAALGTPDGQLTLVDLASRQTAPLEVRQEAATAFAQTVARHGLLLTSDQILRQYDRYNASANADSGTQQVLGAVLDAVESQRARQHNVLPTP